MNSPSSDGATAKNTDALAMQPGVLDARGRILADTLYLKGVLTGARNRGLAPELIERLEDAVDHGHLLHLHVLIAYEGFLGPRVRDGLEERLLEAPRPLTSALQPAMAWDFRRRPGRCTTP